jgi:hypothetical protein
VIGLAEAGALDKIRRTPIQRWKHKARPKSDKAASAKVKNEEHIGPMVEEAPDEIVDRSEEGHEGLRVGAATFLAWQAIQELSEKVDELAKENEALSKENESLRERVDSIEQALYA